MANYSTYFNLLCGRTNALITYAFAMALVFMYLQMLHVFVRCCMQRTFCTCINTCTCNKCCMWLFKYFYKLVSWMTNQLFEKQMSLDKNYSILTFNGRQHKIENWCQLINILVWMFLSEISVISTITVLVIIKFNYDINITNTCWPGLHTGTDCFPIDIDEHNNFTCGEFEGDIPPVNCNEWDNTNPVICFKRKYFPLTVALALLTALIKLILPNLMSIIGVIINGIICCCSKCKVFNNFITIAYSLYFIFIISFIAISIAFGLDLQYHWIRSLESESYNYIAELIVGIAVIIQELIIFPWIDLWQIRIDEDNKIFSDNYETLDSTTSLNIGSPIGVHENELYKL